MLCETSAIACSKASSLALEGTREPDTFLTNCLAAACISASLGLGRPLPAGGLRRTMLRHTTVAQFVEAAAAAHAQPAPQPPPAGIGDAAAARPVVAKRDSSRRASCPLEHVAGADASSAGRRSSNSSSHSPQRYS
jgi:hypothetical protein